MGPPNKQVAYTLTACCRCRSRKTRCDPGLPKCGPCERNQTKCEYYDAAKGKIMLRGYVLALRKKVSQLEQQLTRLSDSYSKEPEKESIMRYGGWVAMKESDEEPRYLGPASGIAMTRLVMDFAKKLCETNNIKDIVSESQASEIRRRLAKETSRPTSKSYPLISSVAAPGLPSLELTESLIDNFCAKAQSLYPILHEPSFYEAVHDVFQGSTNGYKNFTLRIVIAISIQKLDPQYAGLADSYYLAALPHLEKILHSRSIETLQCFVLIALYSMTTPTRTAAYWIVGLATRMCQDLGLTDETTLATDKHGMQLNPLDLDIRRRVFWACLSLELGLSHSLGRPSAFGMTHESIQVKPFLNVDDRYINASGIDQNCPISTKKCIAMHLMRMRLLQLEIRRTLYLNKRSKPQDNLDPWFRETETKIEAWLSSSPQSNEISDFDSTWFEARYNTMMIFLYRPSPQVTTPSVRAAHLCYAAASFTIHIQRKQIDNKAVDVTWIFTQTLFMAINTLLWSLSYPEIRHEHPKSEVEGHVRTALEGICLTSVKWPGVDVALELYTTLSQICLNAYNIGASGERCQPAVSTAGSNQWPIPPVQSNLDEPLSKAETPSSGDGAKNHSTTFDAHPPLIQRVIGAPAVGDAGNAFLGAATYASKGATPYSLSTSPQGVIFDSSSPFNPLPSPLPNVHPSFLDQSFLGSFFSQPMASLNAYLFQPTYYPSSYIDGLNLEDQSKLMDALEASGVKF